jgi:hypothetical protein
MDIPQLSSVPLTGVAGTTAIAPLAAPAADDAVIVAPAAPSLTTVDLSPLGRFLSATSLFQKKLIELQVSSTSVPDSQAGTFGEVAAATTAFAVAFNELQASSLDGTDAETGRGESLAGLFARQFGAETSAAGANQGSALDSLASIGVRFNADPTVDPDARLTVDLPLLQVALEVDPATTTALLERAGAAFGTLVQAEVQPADLGATAEPPASVLPDLTAPAPGTPLPEDAFEQQSLTENARVATAPRDNLGAVSAPATPQAALAEVVPSPAPATLEASPATTGAALAAADALAARNAVAKAQANAQGNAPAADPTARTIATGAQAPRSTAAAQAQEAFERATQARAATPATPTNTTADVQELVNAGNSAATPAVPAFQAIPVTPPASAALPGTTEAVAEVARQSAATPVTRPAAEKELADRALELAENKRSQSAYEEERAQLADRIEELDRQRVAQQEVEDRGLQLRRQAEDLDARRLAAGQTQAAVPAATVAVRAVPSDLAQPELTAADQARPLAPLLASGPPSARDPAVAAAIAAYSLNTGPFAALNARQELAAQRVKTVPAVSSVARVAPIETETAPKGGTRQ